MRLSAETQTAAHVALRRKFSVCGHPPYFFPDQKNCQDTGSRVRNRTGIHDSVNSHKEGEDQDHGDQEQNLSCHGKHNTAGGFADGSEKVSGHRLQAVQEGTEHKNAEILLGKLIIKLVSGTEKADDLPGEVLETYKCSHSQNSCCSGCAQIRLFHPGIVFGAVIKSHDRL